MGSDFIATLAENGKVHLSLSALIFCIIIPGREACPRVGVHTGLAVESKEESLETRAKSCCLGFLEDLWHHWKVEIRASACHCCSEYWILLLMALVWEIQKVTA